MRVLAEYRPTFPIRNSEVTNNELELLSLLSLVWISSI